MTAIAIIDIASEAFDLGQVFAGTDARINLSQFVPLDDQFIPFCWVDTDAIDDLDRFEHEIETDPRVAAFDRLDGAAGRTLYRIEWAAAFDVEDGFLTALREHDLIVERGFAMAGSDDWTLRLRALDHEALTRFQHRCVEHGIGFDVRQVIHGSTGGDDPYGLTDKQREALVLAFEEGYFAVPREIDLSELAARIGISRQAYTRRLDRALRNYLTETGIAELERPEREGQGNEGMKKPDKSAQFG